ncbi:unnamed protein product [Amoebophrya sp. A25]|nr:unnamed protein product [Amoebophrya sp. A25]|eukprot:GSA25T00006256001.1
MASAEWVPPSLESILQRMREECYPKRIRPMDFFRDYDNFKRYEMTESQFMRCLKQLMPSLGPIEWEVLIAAYKLPSGMVNYRTLVEEIEKIFTKAGLAYAPTAEVPAPGSGMTKAELPPLDERMHAILYRVALLCRTRAIVMKYAFEDADRGQSTSLLVPRRGGKVTEPQFRRFFPLNKDFTEEEITLLIHRYRDPEGNVNYKALHEEVTDPTAIVKDAPVPTSKFIPPPETQSWSHEKYNILERVTAKLIELRIKPKEYFQDFDPLRKGFCTIGNLDTVFGILGLKFRPEEMEELKGMYRKEDLNLTMFNYQAFCEAIGSAFTYDQVHKDPLATVSLPTSAATLPSRRSRLELSDEEKAKIDDIESNIRLVVSKKRILFVNAFKDFDRTNQGHVTVDQFQRVMATLNLLSSQDDTPLKLLAKKYCDLGSPKYFNYVEFSRVCEPAEPDMLAGAAEAKLPYEKPMPSRYFDMTGKCYDVTDGRLKGGD